jgi:16S rRNA (uracil1498-N3)-methyltransferase
MTHRFLVEPHQIQGSSVTFADAQARQIVRVLRLRAGDRVRVFDGVTPIDRVVELREAPHGRLVGEHPQASEPRTKLIAYPTLLRREKFESVLQKLTEIGVAAIGPVRTARSLVRDGPDERQLARWRAILREAAEQSGRGVVPRLLAPLDFSQAVAAAEGCVLVAYEGERRRELPEALASKPGTVSLFVGPEGGYTTEEVACAERAGAHLITLGPRVLRTETASPLLAGLVLYELGDLSCAADDQ